jgi:integrase
LVYKSLEDHFGAKCPLSRITNEAVLNYTERLRRRGRAPSTINKRQSILSVLFDEAIKWKKYNGDKPTMVPYKVRNARRRLITPEEEAKAISLCIQSSPFERAMADLIVVLADTGMRLSEALGIQPRNVDQELQAVLIVDTKNGDDRIIPLTGRALEVLGRRNVAPVFQPLSPSVVSHTWRRIRRKMGLQHEKEFVLHALRHTFGTTLANAGTDSFRLQKVMGHRSVQSTQRYVKVSPAALRGLSSIIEQRTAKYQKEVSARPPSTDTP